MSMIEKIVFRTINSVRQFSLWSRPRQVGACNMDYAMTDKAGSTRGKTRQASGTCIERAPPP
jgi:hypothetical protein